MVETSVVVQTIIFAFMIGAFSTDLWWGRFDAFGPYPRRPLPEGYVDRWPKKQKEEES